MTRVLFFIDRLRLGGIQALARDIIQHTDAQKMSIDVLTLDDGIRYPLEETLRSMGTRLYRLDGIWLRRPWDYLSYKRAVDGFFSEHRNYDAVHMHSSSKNCYILESAERYGIQVRVAHSHNTGFQTRNPLSVLLGNMLKPRLMQHATHLVGCSEMACQWLFGKDSVQNGIARVIHNGIDPDAFRYDTSIRDGVRKELGVEGKFVVGHVGRFEKQKNHTFLLDIFAAFAKQCPESVLVLVGIGSLESAMKQKVQRLGIADKVLFLGFRDDRERIMQAMDYFLFPSLYEGFSVVLVEAQAVGLPVLVSDSTTKETAYTGNMMFKSLADSSGSWAGEIQKYKACFDGHETTDRSKVSATLRGSEFDINMMVESLYELYTEK